MGGRQKSVTSGQSVDSGRGERAGDPPRRRKSRRKEPLVPIHYFENLADYAERRGSSGERLFRRARIDWERARTSGFVTAGEFRSLLLATEAETASPWFTLELGCTLSPASHGALGLAVLASADLREALSTLVRYIRTRTPLVRVETHTRDGVVHVRVSDAVVLGDVQRLVHELVLGTVITALRALTGDRFRASEIRVAWPEPPLAVPYERFLVVKKVVFDAPQTEIRFDAHQLDLGVLLADRTAARLAIEKLEGELRELEGRMDLRDRVRERLLKDRGAMPDCERVARDLHTTERTLRRHLAALGTSFHEIVQTTRKELAIHYLKDTELPVGEIAERLGYSDPSNFGAAFRAWTGSSPRAYRKR